MTKSAPGNGRHPWYAGYELPPEWAEFEAKRLAWYTLYDRAGEGEEP